MASCCGMLQALIVHDEMMVDSTAVRVGATSDASDANVAQSAAASSVVDVAEGDSVATTCAAKCSKCDEQHSYEKRHR